MHWLFNEGASSRLGEAADRATTPDSMSLGSLQVSELLQCPPCQTLERRCAAQPQWSHASTRIANYSSARRRRVVLASFVRSPAGRNQELVMQDHLLLVQSHIPSVAMQQFEASVKLLGISTSESQHERGPQLELWEDAAAYHAYISETRTVETVHALCRVLWTPSLMNMRWSVTSSSLGRSVTHRQPDRWARGQVSAKITAQQACALHGTVVSYCCSRHSSCQTSSLLHGVCG